MRARGRWYEIALVSKIVQYSVIVRILNLNVVTLSRSINDDDRIRLPIKPNRLSTTRKIVKYFYNSKSIIKNDSE